MAENSGSTDGDSRTKPDPYDADAIRQAIEAALKFRNETPYSAAVGAEIAGKNAAQPASAGKRTLGARDTLRLDTAFRIAAYLRLLVS